MALVLQCETEIGQTKNHEIGGDTHKSLTLVSANFLSCTLRRCIHKNMIIGIVARRSKQDTEQRRMQKTSEKNCAYNFMNVDSLNLKFVNAQSKWPKVRISCAQRMKTRHKWIFFLHISTSMRVSS